MKLDRAVDIIFAYGVVGFPLVIISTLYNLMVFVPIGEMSGGILLSTFVISYFICVLSIFLLQRYIDWKRQLKGIKISEPVRKKGKFRKTKEELVSVFCWFFVTSVIVLFFMNRTVIDRRHRMETSEEKEHNYQTQNGIEK